MISEPGPLSFLRVYVAPPSQRVHTLWIKDAYGVVEHDTNRIVRTDDDLPLLYLNCSIKGTKEM